MRHFEEIFTIKPESPDPQINQNVVSLTNNLLGKIVGIQEDFGFVDVFWPQLGTYSYPRKILVRCDEVWVISCWIRDGIRAL